jgi:nicotinamidase-related amidase
MLPAMSDDASMTRSPELMSADDTALLIVDVQSKIIRLVPGHRRIVWNLGRLITGANILGVPTVATEQYPKGLGGTVPELAEMLGDIPEKLMFSCRGCPELFDELASRGIEKILVAGIEAHVCVAQTVLDLLAAGFRVYVAADAVGSRGAIDAEIALRRLESSGASVTTTEAALFEWCEVAGTPEFKKLSELVKQPAPNFDA